MKEHRLCWDLGEAFSDGDTVRFKLGTRKYGDLWAIVDVIDWESINHLRWTVKSVGSLRYATNSREGFTYLHRRLIEPPADMVVDHIDGDGLNNRRSNLRVCTLGENFTYGFDRKRGGTVADVALERWLQKQAKRRVFGIDAERK